MTPSCPTTPHMCLVPWHERQHPVLRYLPPFASTIHPFHSFCLAPRTVPAREAQCTRTLAPPVPTAVSYFAFSHPLFFPPRGTCPPIPARRCASPTRVARHSLQPSWPSTPFALSAPAAAAPHPTKRISLRRPAPTHGPPASPLPLFPVKPPLHSQARPLPLGRPAAAPGPPPLNCLLFASRNETRNNIHAAWQPAQSAAHAAL